MGERWAAEALIAFARALFEAAGFDADKAGTQARLLVEADLMGHTTHGLQLAAAYLADARSGRMRTQGEPAVVAQTPVVLTWDGGYLPGLWLTDRAVEAAMVRARTFGIGAVAIRRSHHIGCLAAFLPRATERGLVLLLASSDPSVAAVAPFGGRKPLYTPDPIAMGIPTDGDPILIDISASITTNGMSARLAKEGRRGAHSWWLDAQGNPTDDPAVMNADPPGSILPMGGLDHGHKGYGLGLMIETLTQGLSGFGRSRAPGQWGAAVYVQAMDPRAFGGIEAFLAETGWLRAACAENPPRPGVERVRLPGEAALARRRAALAEGVELFPGIMATLAAEAAKLGVAVPAPIGA